MQTAANTGQHVTQEAERLGAVRCHRTERFALLRGGNELPAVVLTDFQFIIFCGKTVKLIAIR